MLKLFFKTKPYCRLDVKLSDDNAIVLHNSADRWYIPLMITTLHKYDIDYNIYFTSSSYVIASLSYLTHSADYKQSFRFIFG